MSNNNDIALERINSAIKNKSSYLDLSRLKLQTVPDEIANCIWLYELDLSNNYLNRFPQAVGKLDNLNKLDLSYNFLSEVYIEPSRFYSLRDIDLSYNNFIYLPEELNHFQLLANDDDINLDGNPFYENIPEEIKHLGIYAIQNYIEDIRASRQFKRLFETKLLIVGNGEVGKTTLMKVLINNEFDVEIGKESTTHGITVDTMNHDILFPTSDKYFNRFIDQDKLVYYDYDGEIHCNRITEFYDDINELWTDFPEGLPAEDFSVEHNVKVNLWDFGGQEIYHSTHQFFLTKRSIYIFVWEARKDQDEDSFDYWLNTIKYLSNESPVIIVMNKLDVRYKHIDEDSLKKKFKNIVGFHRVSCSTKEGIKELEENIKHTISGLSHLGDKLPQVWNDLRNHLDTLTKNFIRVDEYYEICEKFQITQEKADYISEYLHILGKILHFNNDSVLQNLIILNPEWATKAVYQLIDNRCIQLNDGRFKFSELKKIWNRKDYPLNKHNELVKLMERFELCFNLIGTDEYIIPELLSSQKSVEDIDKFKTRDSLYFEYQYSFMPAGIFNRIICSLYFIIDKDNYWKNGVIIKNELAKALIQQSRLDKVISIKIIGEGKSNLLAVIRSEIERLHKNLNLRLPSKIDFKEMIPCNCKLCISSNHPHLFDHDILLKFISKKRKTIDCQKSCESVDISKIFDGFNVNKASLELINYMVLAASQLQGNHQIVDEKEDSRNTFITTVLTNKGVFAKDQTKWGKSEKGKQQGELDMKIEDGAGLTISIFEGFNLKTFDKTVISRHIKKIINYDPNGLPENFIFVYSEIRDFAGFATKYISHVKTISINESEFISVEDVSVEHTQGAEIKIVLSQFYRQNKLSNMYHILINLKL